LGKLQRDQKEDFFEMTEKIREKFSDVSDEELQDIIEREIATVRESKIR
jgi:hypothetical protein